MSSVKISSNIRVKEGEAFSLIRLKNKTIIIRLQNMAKKVLKQKAPVRSGKFRRSIKVVESKQRESGGLFHGFVKIMPTAAHSIYVIKKTRPSQGAYVPALKARIKFGMHPGTKANNFISQSKVIIFRKAQEIVDKQYGSGRFDIKRFIR